MLIRNSKKKNNNNNNNNNKKISKYINKYFNIKKKRKYYI